MKNIPQLIRDSMKPSHDKEEKDRETASNISKLFPDAETSMKSRKGKWTTYTRNSYSIPRFIEPEDSGASDSFCAVYQKDDVPKIFVTGKTVDQQTIQSTLSRVSRKMIEQRWLFSHPFKNLNLENGFVFGIKLGFRIMILVGILVLFDLFLLPNNSEAIEKGIAISFLEGDSSELDFSGYESVIAKVAFAVLGEKYVHLAHSMFSLVGFFILPILFITVWAEIGGKRSDKVRMRKLPEEAHQFLYGKEAQKAINAEFRLLQEEEKKNRLYSRLSDLGLNTTKDDFELIYDDMMQAVD